MAPVLKPRQAIEAAAAILRAGKLPPRHVADAIVRTLDATALALALADCRPRKQPVAAETLT